VTRPRGVRAARRYTLTRARRRASRGAGAYDATADPAERRAAAGIRIRGGTGTSLPVRRRTPHKENQMSSTTTPAAAGPSSIAIDAIHVAANVRELHDEHVATLAESIGLVGVLQPLIVRPHGEAYELVAGFHRLAAARRVGLAEVPVVVRDAATADTDRAVENVVRLQLTADEEARALAAMLAGGLSEDGAAQALGWPKARVTARLKLLELPERARALVGAGTIALSSVEMLRDIGAVCAPLLDALVTFLDDEEHAWAAERLRSEPGWVLGQALRETKDAPFAAYLNDVDARHIKELRLGKKPDEAYAKAERLHRQLDRYAYGPPRVRFTSDDIDQARAAGVLIEFERGTPLIVDRALYRELAKGAIARTLRELEQKAATAAKAKKASRSSSATEDPVKGAERERNRKLRELADEAHGANLDLGAALLQGLSTVDPADMRVATFFVYSLMGSDYDRSPYTQTGERIARIASGGIRLCVEELRTDVTKTRKDGSRGRLRIDYGAQPDAAVAWLWRFIEGASSAGELYGRALVVICAEQYASRLVLAQSKRVPATRWGSRKDRAAKALKALAGPALPASLGALERAVKRAHREHEAATTPPAPVKRDATADDAQDAA
jgi:ParB/RepB/Spo0J family partition protein